MPKFNYSSLLLGLSLLVLSCSGAAAPIFNQTSTNTGNGDSKAIKILNMKEFNKKRSELRQCSLEGKVNCNGTDLSSFYSSSNPKEYWKNVGSSFSTGQVQSFNSSNNNYSVKRYQQGNTGAGSSTQYQYQYQYQNQNQNQNNNQNQQNPEQENQNQPNASQEQNQPDQQSQENNQLSRNRSSILLSSGTDSKNNNNSNTGKGYGFVLG